MSKKTFLSIFISAFLISYILEHFILNLNILLNYNIWFVFIYKGFRFKILNIDKIIILFFIYILFTGVWNTIEINYLNSNLNKIIIY